jgi:hypothetical protein
MIQEWSNEKLLIYYTLNELFPIEANTYTYTIGPDISCDFNTSNPIKITSAFCRDNSSGVNNDYKLEVIPNDRYQEVFQKQILTNFPRYLHFIRSWPYGTIELWPVPTRSYTLNISQVKQFSQFTSPQDIVCMPPGYKDALALSLAVKMAPEYGQSRPDLVQMMNDAKALLMINNYEPVLLDTDAALMSRRSYNIYSDRY